MRYLLLLLCFFLFPNCQNDNSGFATAGNQEVKFTVNPALVGPRYNDTLCGISLQPPKGWNRLNIPHKDHYSRSISGVVPYDFAFSNLFRDPNTNEALIIGRVENLDQEILAKLRANPNPGYNKFQIWDTIQHARFQHDKFIVDQFIMQSAQQVTFRLLLNPIRSKEYIELDYSVPRTYYDTTRAKMIESSIGSLQKY